MISGSIQSGQSLLTTTTAYVEGPEIIQERLRAYRV